MIDFIPDENAESYEFAISACLCGVCCRYDGKSNLVPEIKKLYDEGRAILICPEVMGGMLTPRLPSEISGDRVVNCSGEDVTDFFVNGAAKALEVCRKYNVKEAILKQNSPSCGTINIYDGTFSGQKISGMGITARILSVNGIKVRGEKN